MPPKKNSSQVWLVVDLQSDDANSGINSIVAAYTNQQAANSAAEACAEDDATSYTNLNVISIDVKEDHAVAKKTSKANQTKTQSGVKAAKKTKVKADEDVDMDDANEDQIEKQSSNAEKRKKIVEGDGEALAGLSLLFTGTFTMDRKTCEASAIKAGATIATTMKKADIIILGAKPGPKKVTEIEENGYETWSEQEFLNKIQGSDANGAKKTKTSD